MASKDKRQTGKNHTLIQSVRHAGIGLWDVFLAERNFRYHLLISVLVIIAGLICALDLMEWVVVLGCIGAMLVTEVLNSAIERVADQVSGGRFQPLIKQAKDIAASAVLVTAFFSVLIGLIIFGNKIF
jgi:undecaprenol kinase